LIGGAKFGGTVAMLLDYYNAGLVKGAFPFFVSQPTLQPLDKFHKFLNDEERLEEAARRRLDIKEKLDWDGGSPFTI
jgi:hypothetical protein